MESREPTHSDPHSAAPDPTCADTAAPDPAQAGPRADVPDAAGRGALRRRLAWSAVLACSPYLLLKLLWVVGVDVGVVHPDELNRAQWVAANALTFGMDTIAALIAYTLSRPREARIRAWLITLPLWVASGLLVVIMTAVPLSLLGAAVGSTGNPFAGDDFLRPWVYAVVYGGFIVEGAVLLAAFGLYVHERWGALLRVRVRALPDPAGTRDAQRVLGTAAAVLLGVAGVLRMTWALGSDLGMSERWVADRDATGRWMDGVQGGLALIGAVGLIVLVYRIGGARVRGPLAMAWFGAGSAFGWGGWMGLISAGAAPESTLAERTSSLLHFVYTAEMISGVLALTIGWFFLAEYARHAAIVARPAPTQSQPSGGNGCRSELSAG
ncbi:hypothetical protein [Embleya scabrispora]|uniref:hypothetical protein n=1 Tax=Embleya scabrispora TaxID=159449 RepID=UPI000382EF06|nr:hypothetical protein [Embleya scabrispora]MYS86519.1 hypothetical protein [Streptomyces sp. SID5474]